MNVKNKIYKCIVIYMFFLLGTSLVLAQSDTNVFKAQIALGTSSPSNDGFVSDFKGKPLNFPTVNLGFQYMFIKNFGLKLDYGFNRISNNSNSPEFKLNYTRINLQLVYDASKIISFSNRTGVFFHAGPGYSTVKPLGNFTANDVSFLNIMGGVELHYGISDSLSLFLDTSYILGMGEDFNPVSSGFGAFNGHLLTVTFGASISLSGCYFCGD